MKYTCYKVVRKTKEDRFYSAIVRCMAKLEYIIGKETIPTVGKIFVFSDISYAEYFIRQACYNISSCILEGKSTDLPIRCDDIGYHYTVRDIRKWWRWREKHSKFYCHLIAPAGTHIVGNFTPTKEVGVI